MKRKRTPSPDRSPRRPTTRSPNPRRTREMEFTGTRSARSSRPDYTEIGSEHDSPDRKNGTRESRRTRSSDLNNQSGSKRLSSPILSRRRAISHNETNGSGSESDAGDKSRNQSANVTFSPSTKVSPMKTESRTRRLAARKAQEKLQNGYSDDDSNVQYHAYPRRTSRISHHPTETSRAATGRDASEADHESSSEDEAIAANGTSSNHRNNQDDSMRRRSTRLSKSVIKNDDDSDDESQSESQETSSSEDISKNHKKRRSHRNIHPVQRLSYDKPERPQRSKRHRSEEIRPLDKYSSEEEFRGNGSSLPRRKKYNIRKQRPRKRLTNVRDSSPSSSASSDSAEEKFRKRKNKRMNIERTKMGPLNMGANEMKLAVFRDRRKVGTSCADIQPMEVDLKTSFESVGGSASHIQCLKEMVVLPLLYPEIFSKFSVTPPRGVLFHGPPGTGKTLLARALAAECSNDTRKVAFYMRKGADVLSKWVGESERQLRLLFEQAYLTRPSIIFFDEFDGLAPVRSSKQDQIHSTIVSTLLALIDGLDSRGEVIVIGATNRIENIDSAFRRPGRFDRELRFQLPTREARKEILKVHTKPWKPAVPDRLIDKLADTTIGYSGADLKGLCAEAVLRAIRRRYPQVYKTSQKLGINTDAISVMETDFKTAMADMVPSTHRVHDQIQRPVSLTLGPLLNDTMQEICQSVDSIFSPELCFKPRMLIRGEVGQGLKTYVGPAILHHFEKIPCHLVNSSSLFSGGSGIIEERLCQIFNEARRTVPSILYIPRIQDLFLYPTILQTFLSQIEHIQPTSPLLILAVAEYPRAGNAGKGNNDETAEIESFIEQIFAKDEIVDVEKFDEDHRAAYFKPLADAVTEMPVVKEEETPEVLEEGLPIVQPPQWRELSELEEKRLRRQEEAKLRELRIFLREIWHKINSQSKFRIFQNPVDMDECDDYLQYVQTPMDLFTMMEKLDMGSYPTAQSFLDDIDLIAENARAYNSEMSIETNRMIVHAANNLKDFAYALIKAEMDTDFEDDCREIVERRKRLTEKLEEASSSTAMFYGSEKIETPKSGKKKSKKKSSWSRGNLPKPKRSTACEPSESENTEEESDPESHHTPNKPVNIDSSKVSQTFQQLAQKTENRSLDELEKIYVQINTIIQQNNKNLNRKLVHGLVSTYVEKIE